MELIESIGIGFQSLIGWAPLLAMTTGVIIGILVGAMPGLSPSMGVALLVPFTYTLEPSTGIILLVSIYLAASYGGSITAITINAPGTPSAVVTAFDGYPMTRKGKAGTALGISLVASTAGGLLGVLVLIFFSVPLAKLALKCHPAEYFALAVMGLTTVASLGGGKPLKALTAAVLGLLINTIGIDPISGVSRFTFGLPALFDGFALIPALIGLFAVGEILLQIENGISGHNKNISVAAIWPSFSEYWKLKMTIVRSSIMGSLIGIFPGAGATIASFISYDAAKRLNSHPETFGHGNPVGVAAAEAANSSSVGGALVPLLALGIPGSATTAVLIGALMIHDVVPGPRLFVTHPELVYGIFASLLVANLLLLIIGLFGCRIWIKVTHIPKPFLFPLILAVAVLGSYSVRFSMFDVFACLGFGALGWLFRRNDYPVAPIVLGMVLGTIIETNFRQAILMGGYSIFLLRPVSAIVLALSAISFLWPLWRRADTEQKEK